VANLLTGFLDAQPPDCRRLQENTMTRVQRRLFGPCSLAWFVTVTLALVTRMGVSATANTGSAPPDPVLE